MGGETASVLDHRRGLNLRKSRQTSDPGGRRHLGEGMMHHGGERQE